MKQEAVCRDVPFGSGEEQNVRATSSFLVCAALMSAACGDDAEAPAVTLDGGIDGGSDGGIDGGGGGDGSTDSGGGGHDASGENCERRKLCENGALVDVDGLCTRDCYGTGKDCNRSAGLHFACLVDPNGTLYYSSQWGGDVVVSSPNWTYNGWSNGLVPSTLSEADAMRCIAAKAARADAGVGVCRDSF
jgi:hypothetical protein